MAIHTAPASSPTPPSLPAPAGHCFAVSIPPGAVINLANLLSGVAIGVCLIVRIRRVRGLKLNSCWKPFKLAAQ